MSFMSAEGSFVVFGASKWVYECQKAVRGDVPKDERRARSWLKITF